MSYNNISTPVPSVITTQILLTIDPCGEDTIQDESFMSPVRTNYPPQSSPPRLCRERKQNIKRIHFCSSEGQVLPMFLIPDLDDTNHPSKTYKGLFLEQRLSDPADHIFQDGKNNLIMPRTSFHPRSAPSPITFKLSTKSSLSLGSSLPSSNKRTSEVDSPAASKKMERRASITSQSRLKKMSRRPSSTAMIA